MSTRSALGTLPTNSERALDAKSRRQTISTISKRKSLGGASVNRRQSIGRKSMGRMSISNSRLSMGGSRSRRASVMPSRKPGGKQDPRPLTDKQYKLSSIKTLIRFLNEKGYENKQLSPKLLGTPNSKEFYRMVEFLYRQIDPNYTLEGKKVAEAIPAIFKSLGYPFPISKTTLYAVSPHTWPALLAALSWLVELLTYQELVEEREEEAANTLQEDNAEKLFFKYLSDAYGTFMAGDDDNIERLDRKLADQFTRRNENVANAIAALEADAAQLQHATQRLIDSPMSLDNLTHRHTTVSSDLQKFRQLITELEAHREAVEQKFQQHQTDLSNKEREIDVIRQEIEELNERLGKQKLRPADVERLQSERMSLERTVRALAEERSQVDDSAREKSATIAATREAVDSALATYHSTARRLALIPSNAANAKGRTFTISVASDDLDHDDTGIQSVLSVDIKGSIVPALEETLEEMREAVIEDQKALLELSTKKEAAEENRVDNDSELERLNHRKKKLESSYAMEKQRAETELRTIESEIEQIQSEIDQAKDATVNGLERATALVGEKKQLYMALLAQCNEEKVAVAKVMAEMARVVSVHKEFVGDALDDTFEFVEQEVTKAAQD